MDQAGAWGGGALVCNKKATIATDEFAKKVGGYCATAALPAIAWALGQMPRLLDALSDLAKSLEAWLTFLH